MPARLSVFRCFEQKTNVQELHCAPFGLALIFEPHSWQASFPSGVYRCAFI